MIEARVERLKLIKKYPEKLREVNRRFLPKGIKWVTADAKRLAPKDTNRLADSIDDRVEGDKAISYTNVEYAADNEYGTKPHEIVVNGPVKIKGVGWRYLKTVKHPGTKAQPFFRPAIDRNKVKLIALYRKIFRSVYGQ